MNDNNDRSLSPTTPAAARTCVFTIVSRNYLHFARNLMASVGEHLPGAQRVIVLCDSIEGVDAGEIGIPLLGIEALDIAHVDRMVYQYSILELNTAIKPFAFAKLLATRDCDKVIYFDPDIQLFGSGAPLLARLDAADVVLTPHLTAPLDDDRHPSDLSILQSGSYNLGFLALRRSDTADRLLAWWQQKLARDCVVDIPRGLFTDQKWMDLVPGLYDGVHVERHPGWNVAYWNLLHRAVTHDDDNGFRVNGLPLFFFHFSGHDPVSRSISKHQDRYTLDQCVPAVQRLFAQYAERLEGFGRQHYRGLPYAFAALSDGTPLPDCARQVIRNEIDWDQALPDFRGAEGARFLVGFLTSPVDDLAPSLSRLAMQLHRSRPDLQAAFPDVLGAHRRAFLDWFAARASAEAGVPAVLAPPLAREAPAVAPAPAPMAPPRAGVSLPFRWAYRLAWGVRHLLRPFTSVRFRNAVRAYLVRRAYPPQPTAQPAAVEALPSGITVIGYLQAESGVGESARATLRALHQTDIAHSLSDYRAGNVSRMGEAVDVALADGRRHAISLFHINADQLPLARTVLGEAPFSVPYRIGFWAWELENFPSEWRGAFSHVDEVWTPSSFCQRAIAQLSPVPVLCMPQAIEIPTALAPDRARFGLRLDSVVFLAMADMLSSAERKNPLGAVEAFIAAFAGRRTEVELVVKVSNASREPAALARLQARAATCPGIHLITDYLDRPALNSLIDSCDAFISLHRAEGFGLVIAEAMARAKVVVATGWSGNMDFMNAHNALPVDYRLRPLTMDIGPYKRGERWAEPDLDDAVEKIRAVAERPALRRTLGERARADCEQQLSPAVVGRRIKARIAALDLVPGG